MTKRRKIEIELVEFWEGEELWGAYALVPKDAVESLKKVNFSDA